MFSGTKKKWLSVLLSLSFLSAPIVHSSATFKNNHMTLRDKIAQMLIMGFDGTKINPSDPKDQVYGYITESKIGGVILFDETCYASDCTDLPVKAKNVSLSQQDDQLKTLTADLQKYARKANPNLPLLISIDYEGGEVQRLIPADEGNDRDNNFPETESAYQLGTVNVEEPGLAKAQYKEMAHTLEEYGFNLNFAPVIDLNYPSSFLDKRKRTYSENPETVVDFANIAINAYQNKNILTTLKHFPGHGSAGDTHGGFVDITETWEPKTELEPYRKLLKNPKNDLIMVAHVFNENLDPDYPASLSYRTITELLRSNEILTIGNEQVNGLGFEGVVVTDDMQMGAITEEYGMEEAVICAVQAGVDMLIFGNNLSPDMQDPEDIIDWIEGAIDDGNHSKCASGTDPITEERIDESYQRILKLKQRLSDD